MYYLIQQYAFLNALQKAATQLCIFYLFLVYFLNIFLWFNVCIINNGKLIMKQTYHKCLLLQII